MANRWAPWIEEVARASGDTTINSTTAIAVAGATVMITAKIATRLRVVGCFDMHCQAHPGGAAFPTFIGELFVDGVVQTGNAPVVFPGGAAIPAYAARLMATQQWIVDLAAGATSTLDLRVRASAVVAGFTVVARITNTTLGIFGMPSEGIAY